MVGIRCPLKKSFRFAASEAVQDKMSGVGEIACEIGNESGIPVNYKRIFLSENIHVTEKKKIHIQRILKSISIDYILAIKDQTSM